MAPLQISKKHCAQQLMSWQSPACIASRTEQGSVNLLALIILREKANTESFQELQRSAYVSEARDIQGSMHLKGPELFSSPLSDL